MSLRNKKLPCIYTSIKPQQIRIAHLLRTCMDKQKLSERCTNPVVVAHDSLACAPRFSELRSGLSYARHTTTQVTAHYHGGLSRGRTDATSATGVRCAYQNGATMRRRGECRCRRPGTTAAGHRGRASARSTPSTRHGQLATPDWVAPSQSISISCADGLEFQNAHAETWQQAPGRILDTLPAPTPTLSPNTHPKIKPLRPYSPPSAR